MTEAINTATRDHRIDAGAFDQTLRDSPRALDVFRDTLKLSRERLAEVFIAGTCPTEDLVHDHAEIVDFLLLRTSRLFGLDAGAGVSLIAVGGYGRGELHPGSDVDLLLLLEDGGEDNSPQLSDFITFLWDIGLAVGHSVRTLAQCVDEAERDITVATSLMEARLIAGNAESFRAMRVATGPEHVWPARRFFEAKWQEQVSRHQKFHDTAYNLEPNVKDGPGGLRDIQMIGWVAKRHFGAETLHDLVDHEFLNEDEYRTLIDSQNFLWRVRFALHVLTGRGENRLLFDHQGEIAEMFGYRDQPHSLAIEQMMKRYYRTIMELSRLNEMLLELFQEVILHVDVPVKIVSLGKHFQARNGFLEVTDNRVFKRYPFALLELFLLLQQHPELEGVRATTIRLIRDHRYLIGDDFRADIQARGLFMEIIRQPRGISHELRRMHRYGVLAAYLPAFERVVGQMQYDLFHAYTVDEHTLFVVSNLRAFATPEHYHELPLCSAVFQRIHKPELLYLAGFFHDIAKGRGGDHSELGADEARAFCHHHGLSNHDTQLVAWLVDNHLMMSVTAQRKDIHDPDVVKAFALKVGDRARLDYLYLLTVADIRATNPNLWNDWKDSLLRELYEATERSLRRGVENPIDTAELVAETRDEAHRRLGTGAEGDPWIDALWRSLGDDYFLRATPEEIAWHTRAIVDSTREELPLVLVRNIRSASEIFIYTEDQDYIFAAATSALNRAGLTVLHARIITADNGMTLDSFVVLDDTSGAALSGARERDVRKSLRNQLLSPAKAVREVNRSPRRQLRHFSTPTQVHFETDRTNDRTLMEITSGDRPGLLSRVAWCLADQGARLKNAKIMTIGERAEDVFFITDHENRALDDEHCARLREQILKTLDNVRPAASTARAASMN